MQPFSPDVRNLGGRSMIANHMYNHLVSVDQAQSALKRLLKPAQPAIKRRPSPLYKLYEHFQQVLNTFQKV